MHVLIPFDVNPVSERAVTTALDILSGHDDIHITAVHVSDRESTSAKVAASSVESMASDRGLSVDADVRIVDPGTESKPTIRNVIAETIEERDVDLVVIGHEEKSLFEQLFRSDTSERALEIYEIPVLIVP